jgi:hypothetical protein
MIKNAKPDRWRGIVIYSIVVLGASAGGTASAAWAITGYLNNEPSSVFDNAVMSLCLFGLTVVAAINLTKLIRGETRGKN